MLKCHEHDYSKLRRVEESWYVVVLGGNERDDVKRIYIVLEGTMLLSVHTNGIE